MRRSTVGTEWPQFEFSPKRRDDEDVQISESPSPFKGVVVDLTAAGKMRIPTVVVRNKRKKSPKNDRRKTLALSFGRVVVPSQVPSISAKSLVEQVDKQRAESVNDNVNLVVVKTEMPATPEKIDSCRDMFDDDDASLSPVLDDTYRIQAAAKARNLSAALSAAESRLIQSTPLLFSSPSTSIVIDADTDERPQSQPFASQHVSIQMTQSDEREASAQSSLLLHEACVSSIQEVEEEDDSLSRSATLTRSASAPPPEYEPTSSAEVDQPISGRLRRRFMRGGLADQLYRAANGARSERAVWLQATTDQRRIPELALRVDQVAVHGWGLIKLRSTDADGREWDVLMRHDWLPRTMMLTVGSWLWVYKPTVIVAASTDRFDRSLLVCPPFFRVDGSAPSVGPPSEAPPGS